MDGTNGTSPGYPDPDLWRDLPPLSGPCGKINPRGLTRSLPDYNPTYADPKKFRSDSVNYFDLEAEDENNIILINKYIFYKDIYIFVDRLKNLIIIKIKIKIKKI